MTDPKASNVVPFPSRSNAEPAWLQFPNEELEKLTQEAVNFALEVQSLPEDDRRMFNVLIRALPKRS